MLKERRKEKKQMKREKICEEKANKQRETSTMKKRKNE
jgi:hypothetical protein